jgi:hypothetical protein
MFAGKTVWHGCCAVFLSKSKRKDDIMKLSFVPLLVGGSMLSPEARNALSEDRREDAAALLMREYDLDCREAGELVDVSVCDEQKTKRPVRRIRGA